MRATVHRPRNATRALGFALRAQPGMTLLEMMIVLAIIAMVMGILVGPSVIEAFATARKKTARMEVKQYAYQAYPQWAAAHADQECPARLDELNEFTNRKDIQDPWQHDYKMYCGTTLPPQAKGLAASSLGPDGTDRTGDDLRSWD